MAGRVRTSGNCGYCGRELTAGGLTGHLRSCAARRKAIEQADHEDLGRLPLVNSPRCGVCGYGGPAEAPW